MNAQTRTAVTWRGGIHEAGRTFWNVEQAPLYADIDLADWTGYRTLRLRIGSPRRTGARVRLEALGPKGVILGHVTFSADWVGENDMQLWLDNLQPLADRKRWREVRRLRLSCEQPGLWPTTLSLGAVELSADAPTWRVNESDTVIAMSWHHLMARGAEWHVVPDMTAVPGGEPFRESPQPMSVINREEPPRPVPGDRPGGTPSPWLLFGFRQGSTPGLLTVERRFDLDIGDQQEILAKLFWDKDTSLTVQAIVDGGRAIALAQDQAPIDSWRTVGAPLDGARHLDAVRLTISETSSRTVEEREVMVSLLWILVRRPTELDTLPAETVAVRLVHAYDPYPQQVETLERAVRQAPFQEPDESTTPIGDPVQDGLPFGFYVRREDLPALRERALHGSAKRAFESIRAEADRAISTELADRNYYGWPYGGGVGHPKGFRGSGLEIFAPVVAVTHLITGEARYALAARRWILRAAHSDDWCSGYGGCVARPQVGDILPYWDHFTSWHPRGFSGYMDHPFRVAGSALGVVVAYDMLYHCFSPEERDLVETAFASHGTYILADKLRQSRTFYVSMNQGLLFALPLLMQTAFLKNRDPVYAEMHEWSLDFLREFGTRPWNEEGVCGEGPGYGSGSLSAYIEALPPMAACMGLPVQDIVPPALHNVMEYLAHARSTWAGPEQFAGKPHFLGLSDSSDYMWLGGIPPAFFANYRQDPVAQYFWEESFADNPPVSPTLLLVLGDGVAPHPPMLPPATVFRDQPMAFFRTGWRPGDTLVAMTNIRHVTCHGHKDRGSVILEYGGEQLLLDPGMISYNDPATDQYEETFCHNTMTLGQRSQSGGTAVYDTAIVDFISTSGEACPGEDGGVDWAIADATAVYPGALMFHRHVLFLRPDVCVLYDQVIAQELETIALNFTCLGPFSWQALPGTDEPLFAATTDRNRLLLHTQATVPLTHRTSGWGTHWPEIPSYRLVRATAVPAAACDFLTVLVPHSQEATAPLVEPAADRNWLGARVTVGDREEWVLYRRAVRGYRSIATVAPGIETDAQAAIVRRAAGEITGVALWNGTHVASGGRHLLSTTKAKGLAGRLTRS